MIVPTAPAHRDRPRLSVWAPEADRVRLVIDEDRHELLGAADGWWSPAADAALPTGSVDYGYLIDDGDTVLPDPRSRLQPDGVHGRSRTDDAAAFAWTDGAWTGRQLAGGLVYELHIGTFTPAGTLDAAIERLDHLVELGVTHVELLPVNAFDGTHNWGYDGVLWFAVQSTYGGPAAYRRFVDACHAHGLAVVQDVVYNHLGPSGNVLPAYGPYLHEAAANPWGLSLNLDGERSDEVRRYVLDNVAMWFEDFHVDGLRLDAVHALVDERATHILEEMAQLTDSLSAHLGRPLTLIAESDMNDPTLITSREAHGYGLTAQWSDDFHHAVHVALTGETTGYYEDFAPLGALAAVLERGFFHAGTYSSFRGRHHGRPIDLERTPTSRLVVFAQDHDQIGNRAIGDRISATLDADRLAVSAVLTLANPFTPMLFMGEEWGASTPWQFFTSHTDEEIGTATEKGRIEEFARMGWDPDVVPNPQDPATFERSKLDWAELEQPAHARLLQLYRRLGRLRRERPELTDPRFTRTQVEFDETARWIRFARGGVTVAVNLGDAAVDVLAAGDVLLATHDDIAATGEVATLPPSSAVITAETTR